MRRNDRRKQLPRRWARLAAYHRHAAHLCDAIGKAIGEGRAYHGLRMRLAAVDRRGGAHRSALLWAMDVPDAPKGGGQ